MPYFLVAFILILSLFLSLSLLPLSHSFPRSSPFSMSLIFSFSLARSLSAMQNSSCLSLVKFSSNFHSFIISTQLDQVPLVIPLQEVTQLDQANSYVNHNITFPSNIFLIFYALAYMCYPFAFCTDLLRIHNFFVLIFVQNHVESP